MKENKSSAKTDALRAQREAQARAREQQVRECPVEGHAPHCSKNKLKPKKPQ